ncbi:MULTISPECIES: hypothetical protein [unclassified Microcoleus]|nr:MULTISPECIES: hypothetical protein [unclassified Microcoleus]
MRSIYRNQIRSRVRTLVRSLKADFSPHYKQTVFVMVIDST